MMETVYAPRRHEDIMMHKNTINALDQASICTAIGQKNQTQTLDAS